MTNKASHAMDFKKTYLVAFLGLLPTEMTYDMVIVTIYSGTPFSLYMFGLSNAFLFDI